ncbi:hypothetical protein POM88_050745 [Heracleum sosnowskyi]|uniref:Uncharacterized protein n=1 Tax=Heracleum sosnowskyi TaxID=360622 RepID=A0AAD8GZ91_9APIA|nr:hypothetical protein POM88_050745 [Heracleum sosnowskyi]
MRKPDSDEFDYPGCPAAYKEFVKAVVAYQKRLNCSTSLPKPLKLDQETEKKRKVILKSFSLARNLYERGSERNFSKESELEAGAEFLEMGATVRNSSSYYQKMKLTADRERKLHDIVNDLAS